MVLRKFLGWCYKNADDKREFVIDKKAALRRRLKQVAMIDREIEHGFCMLKQYVKGGDYWLNCLESPEPFWYLN